MTQRLFVYGTLMPDHEAWPVVEPYAQAVAPTVVRGRLYDTGAGYPAARFGEATGTIAGVAVTLVDVLVDDALATLDRYEGFEYRRIVVSDDHGPLYTYEWIGASKHLVELPSGSWTGQI